MSKTHRIIAGTICALVLLLLPGWALRHARTAEVEARRAELAELREANAAQQAANEDVRRDAAAIREGERVEHLVRERLHAVKSNETVVLVEPATSPAPAATGTAGQSQ